ncbi:MAG TPA: hexose kinase [Candidatus Cybelea sp.]|nr:hexose kinase [Candidatus Cybelea sp.]
MIAAPILCVSANPAIDRRLRFDSFAAGRINRAGSAEPLAGGKAAHVATAARALGARTAWLGFLGGPAGDEFLRQFRKFDIQLAAISTTKPTRMNLELIENSGRITEVLEPGGEPTRAELKRMVETLRRGLQGQWSGSVVVISGSLPVGVAPSFYRVLIAVAKTAGSPVLLDTSGEALRASLASGPDFVKPNKQEAEEVVGRRLRRQAATLEAATALIGRGARSAAISLGPEGLLWIEAKNGPTWLAQPPHLEPLSTVGSGDAVMAGFAVAAARRLSGEAAIRFAVACGAANCLAKLPGRISSAEVKSLLPRIAVRRIA